ncbi:MAG TPA: cytochrome C oxidase subunit IV family protein [Longimicrobiales bacterium]|nr:cytochrome C oxidase subunit IV family protein [Longimicrobiales bacterium]
MAIDPNVGANLHSPDMPADATHELGAAHPKPRYMFIFGVLAVLTMAEVGVAYLGLPQRILVITLVFMAMWKAGLVAMYYMHLRFEPRNLIFLVIAPLPLAFVLVLAVLTEF